MQNETEFVDKYHKMEIELYGSKQYSQELSDALNEFIANWIFENPPNESFSWTGTFHAEQTAITIEKQAIKDYIDNVDWHHIVDVIKERGELHEYHTALALDEDHIIHLQCPECGEESGNNV